MANDPENTVLSKPRLLDEVRDRLRLKHYSLRTERTYVDWIKRYILFHGKLHPRDLGARHVEAFLTDLAVGRKVSASTQNQALAALLFLYREVLGIELPWLDDIVRAKKPQRLPVVLTVAEVQRLLARLDGSHGLMARMLYGTGMRLMECVRLRVKDVNFERNEIIVRDGKGGKDRVTMLPASLGEPLREHLKRVRVLFEQDRAEDVPGVYLPDALEKKYPNAGKEWGWFWVFPSRSIAADPRTGIVRATTPTNRRCNAQSRRRCWRRALPSRLLRTPCAIPSPPICCNPATISAPCRSCSAIRT